MCCNSPISIPKSAFWPFPIPTPTSDLVSLHVLLLIQLFQCQENKKNNSSMLFCISQFPGLLVTVCVLNPWWRPVALSLAFSTEGVAISWQLPSVPVLSIKGNWDSARTRRCFSWRENSGKPSKQRKSELLGFDCPLKHKQIKPQNKWFLCQMSLSALPQCIQRYLLQRYQLFLF